MGGGGGRVVEGLARVRGGLGRGGGGVGGVEEGVEFGVGGVVTFLVGWRRVR